MEYSPRDKPLAKELSIYLIELKGEEQLSALLGINKLLSARNVRCFFN